MGTHTSTCAHILACVTHTATSVLIEWCRAYFEREHETGIREMGSGSAHFEHDRLLSAIMRRWDAAAVPTLWDYTKPQQLRGAVRRRAATALGRVERPCVLFMTDAPVPRGLVLLPRRTGCLVALQRNAGRVVKVEDVKAYSTLEHEHAALLHLQRNGMAEFGSALLDDDGIYTHATNGSVFRFLRTGYHRNSRRVTAAEWPSLLREWAVPRMFDFYRSWGVVGIDAEAHVAALRRDLGGQGLTPSVMRFVDLVDRMRVSSRSRTVHLTRCHGDLKPENVHRNGSDLRLIDWGNSMQANLFFDLSIPFLYSHHHADDKAAYVSQAFGLNVDDGTTYSSATTFARHATDLTGEQFDQAKLAFQVLCSLAERLRFGVQARQGLREAEDRSHMRLVHSLSEAGLL